jgi:tetratricopeptide (TPR) repeat protein
VPEPLAILGPAGIGKSTITLVALNDRRVAQRYGSRRFFIRCDALRNREAFAAAVATALGLPIGPQVEAAVMTELSSAPTVLAIDNAETPWEGDTLRVEEIFAQLAAVPGLALVASLRGASRPVGVRWRQPIQPPSLPLPEARKVFLAIAGNQFTDDPDLDRLLRALDGVPLAITLMANAAEGQPDLADTWTRWGKERTRMLRRAGGADRLLNIEVSYEISIQGPRMTNEAQRFLSLLSSLPGGVARDDLEDVFPRRATSAAALLRQVGLAFDEANRVRLLTPLREYVNREYPPQLDDLQKALSHYMNLAILFGNKTGREGGAEAVARLTPEVENMESAIMRTLDSPNCRIAIKAASRLAEFSRFTGLGSTMPLEKAAEIAVSIQADDLAARCCCILGIVALDRSDHNTARARFEEALPLFGCVGDELGKADCIKGLGDVALERSDYGGARTRYEEALPLYRVAGNILGEANCIRGLGDIALMRGDKETACAKYEEALPLHRRIGDLLGEANCIARLADTALMCSDLETARTNYEAAVLVYARVGDILGKANCIKGLGEIAVANSDKDAARALFEEALALYERICEPYSIGIAHWRLAQVAVDGARATKHVEGAGEAWNRIGRSDLMKNLAEEFGTG